MSIRVWDDPDSLRLAHEQCIITPDNCRGGLKCKEFSEADARAYLAENNVEDIKREQIEFNDGKVNLCVLRDEEDLSPEGGACKDSGDCRRKLTCNMQDKKCTSFTTLKPQAVDLGVSVFNPELSAITCDYDWECPSGWGCNMTQDPELNVCIPLDADALEDKFGRCRVVESLSSDKTELVPLIEANKSSCRKGYAMTVDWTRNPLDCRCCNMTADPTKRRCGEPTGIVPYTKVLRDDLEMATTLF